LPENGLLIDYEYCTGCHTCEIACKQEHNLPVGKWGIKLVELGPMETSPERFFLVNIPVPTRLCNLCAGRVRSGLMPSCVEHCQARVIKFGSIEELAEDMRKKPQMVLWAPRP
jgi:Fe-S-cluster-containing dehydrogenase component